MLHLLSGYGNASTFLGRGWIPFCVIQYPRYSISNFAKCKLLALTLSPESFPDLLDPINDFFWSNDHYETEALHEASARLQKTLNAKFALADLNAVVQACRHLSEDEKIQNNKPYNIELKEGAKPYHSRPFPVPKK